MEFNEYEQKMIAWMEDHIGGTFISQKVLKENDIVRTGITRLPQGEKILISPTVYIDNLYEKVMRNEMSFPAAASVVENEYLQAINQLNDNMFPKALLNSFDFETVKDRICMRLIGVKTNETLLKECPHKVVAEDLAEVYRVVVDKSADECSSYRIDNKIMKNMGVTVEDLHERAMVNTPNIFPVRIISLTEKMVEIVPDEMKEMARNELEALPLSQNLYVLTNDMGTNGATSILYPGMIEHLQETFGKDIALLPSSVHEIVIYKGSGNYSLEELQDIVRQANFSAIRPEDYLSDNVYTVGEKELVNCTYQENYKDLQLEDFEQPDLDMGMEL